MGMRTSNISRKTKETEIQLDLYLDGGGDVRVSTGIGFFDHMLTLFAYHASFDMTIEASGDLDVDQHHTVEDIGICLGQALSDALGDKKGIKRYGWSLLPMDEALSLIALDLSGRPYLSYQVELPVQLISDFDPTCIKEFLQAVSNQAGITLHVRRLDGDNPHHILEAVFKGLGRALRMAVSLDESVGEIPSTKGTL
jgi:imidazoleglycerol-phosphate dehydratase